MFAPIRNIIIVLWKTVTNCCADAAAAVVGVDDLRQGIRQPARAGDGDGRRPPRRRGLAAGRDDAKRLASMLGASFHRL